MKKKNGEHACRSPGQPTACAYQSYVQLFDRDTESWTSYCERLEQFFLANGVAGEEKGRAILLSACGPTTY